MQMRAENIRFLHHIISSVPVHQIIVSANLFRYNEYFVTFQNMIQTIVIVEKQTISHSRVIVAW